MVFTFRTSEDGVFLNHPDKVKKYLNNGYSHDIALYGIINNKVYKFFLNYIKGKIMVFYYDNSKGFNSYWHITPENNDKLFTSYEEAEYHLKSIKIAELKCEQALYKVLKRNELHRREHILNELDACNEELHYLDTMINKYNNEIKNA